MWNYKMWELDFNTRSNLNGLHGASWKTFKQSKWACLSLHKPPKSQMSANLIIYQIPHTVDWRVRFKRNSQGFHPLDIEQSSTLKCFRKFQVIAVFPSYQIWLNALWMLVIIAFSMLFVFCFLIFLAGLCARPCKWFLKISDS